MAEAAAGAAPGKLMIAGEYAVLDGVHRALAAAVGELVRWRLEAPADTPTIRVHAFDTTFTWRLGEKAPAGIATVVADALRGAAEAGAPLARSLQLHVGGQFGGVKVGLGTSAATVVAAIDACRTGADANVDVDVEALAHDVHFAMQGGKGSGYDIGTIAAGGCVAYDASDRSTRDVPWPDGLFALALFTGEAANTRTAIRRKPTGAILRRMGEASEALIGAWGGGDVAAILEAVQRAQDAFDAAVADGSMLPSDRVDQTCAWIREQGGVARVSGAGGGDCVLAFTADAAHRDNMLAAWQARDGLCVHRLPDDIAPSRRLDSISRSHDGASRDD